MKSYIRKGLVYERELNGKIENCLYQIVFVKNEEELKKVVEEKNVETGLKLKAVDTEMFDTKRD